MVTTEFVKRVQKAIDMENEKLRMKEIRAIGREVRAILPASKDHGAEETAVARTYQAIQARAIAEATQAATDSATAAKESAKTAKSSMWIALVAVVIAAIGVLATWLKMLAGQ